MTLISLAECFTDPVARFLDQSPEKACVGGSIPFTDKLNRKTNISSCLRTWIFAKKTLSSKIKDYNKSS